MRQCKSFQAGLNHLGLARAGIALVCCFACKFGDDAMLGILQGGIAEMRQSESITFLPLFPAALQLLCSPHFLV